MSYTITSTDTTTYWAGRNSSGNSTYTVNMYLTGGDVDIRYENGYKQEYDSFKFARTHVNVDAFQTYSTNTWRRYPSNATEYHSYYLESIFNEMGCLYAGRTLTSQGIKTRMGFLNTEVDGQGMFDWQMVPVKVELINPAYYDNTSATSAPSGTTVYTSNGAYVSSGNISFNISESTLRGYAGFRVTRSTAGSGSPVMFNEGEMYVMFKVTCRYREHFDSRLAGDLLDRGYNPNNNTKDFVMYCDATFSPKQVRVITTRTREHYVKYSGDDSYNVYNSLGYRDTYVFDIYNDLLVSNNHYSYSVSKSYNITSVPVAGHCYYNIAQYPYGRPTLDYTHTASVPVTLSIVKGSFTVPGYWLIDTGQIAPKVSASYTYDKTNDKATWVYNVDATELSRYTNMDYTLQVIGYETHQGTTTEVFDTGIIALGHGTYNYTGSVVGLEAHDMSSTVQFNVYIMYHNVQLPISHAFTKTVSASNDILYFHGTTNGIGIGVPPKEGMLSTSILNITCNPELVQTPSRHTDDINTKVIYKIDDKLIDSPHWMLLGCGVYNSGTSVGTESKQSYIEWYGLPHEACDGRCRFWVLQTYFNDYYPIPQAQKHRTDKPIITTADGDLSTPDDAAVNVMDFMLYTHTSIEAFSGIRSYIWDGYINVHPKTGVAHYQIPIWDGTAGAWTYVDEDDLAVSLI